MSSLMSLSKYLSVVILTLRGLVTFKRCLTYLGPRDSILRRKHPILEYDSFEGEQRRWRSEHPRSQAFSLVLWLMKQHTIIVLPAGRNMP